MFSSNYEFDLQQFSSSAPFTTIETLADISGSQQLPSFLSLAFPWLDIYPALDWLKERKYSNLLCTPYLSLVLLVTFN